MCNFCSYSTKSNWIRTIRNNFSNYCLSTFFFCSFGYDYYRKMFP